MIIAGIVWGAHLYPPKAILAAGPIDFGCWPLLQSKGAAVTLTLGPSQPLKKSGDRAHRLATGHFERSLA